MLLTLKKNNICASPPCALGHTPGIILFSLGQNETAELKSTLKKMHRELFFAYGRHIMPRLNSWDDYIVIDNMSIDSF